MFESCRFMKRITNIPVLPGKGEDYGILGAVLKVRENAEHRILLLLINALDYALSDETDEEHQEPKWANWNHFVTPFYYPRKEFF